MYCASCMGGGPLGGGHGGCDGRRLTAPTMHARCVAPGGRADGVANERLSSLASDAVWQIRSIAGYEPSMGSPSWRQVWM
jgi:hypothetical protein